MNTPNLVYHLPVKVANTAVCMALHEALVLTAGNQLLAETTGNVMWKQLSNLSARANSSCFKIYPLFQVPIIDLYRLQMFAKN